jgi:hypothetical protein
MEAILERAPVTVHVLPREQWTWDQFVDNAPAGSIALDGMVKGGPRFDETHTLANFDHHEGVVREATMATCMQVYMAIKGGLMTRFPAPHVFINDTDQDTSFAVWLLAKHDLFEGTKSIPAVNRLLQLNNFWDITGGAFPVQLDDVIVGQHNWVFEPYTDLRKSGALATASAVVLRDNLESVLARLDRHMMGQSGQVELDTRATVLDRLEKPPCWFIDEIGGNTARYALYAQGMPAFVSIVARRPDGRTVYSIGRRSQYIKFPIRTIMIALNNAETSGGQWGGSDLIGGSPRAEGSELSWQQIRDTVRSCA